MSTLHFKRVDESQTEVWSDGQTPRSQSTQAVRLVLQQLMDRQIFDSFWNQLLEDGDEADLDDPNNSSIASELEIR